MSLIIQDNVITTSPDLENTEIMLKFAKALHAHSRALETFALSFKSEPGIIIHGPQDWEEEEE